MPNRILKESICTSDSIDELSWFAEVLFYRLMVNCDDFGRFDGRIAVIKNRLFPLKEDLTASTVKKGVQSLVNAGLVALYEFESKPYLYLPTWNDHQSVRAKRSKYPAPDDGMITSEISCKQMNADACRFPRNPIQSESNPIRNPNPNARDTRGAEFEKFWSAYPRKEGKQKARAAFEKVTVSLDILLDAIEQQKKSAQWCKENGQFIPHPATWLNGKRWEDQPTMDTSIPQGASGQLGEWELDAIRRTLAREIPDDVPIMGGLVNEA